LQNSFKHEKLYVILSSSDITVEISLFFAHTVGITLLKDNALLFTSIKLIGVVYLLYIGFLLLNASKRDLFNKSKNNFS